MNTPAEIRRAARDQHIRLAEHLATRRVALDVPRWLLSQRLGIDEAKFRAWEFGTRQPTLREFIAWMIALDLGAALEPAELMAGMFARGINDNRDWKTTLATEIRLDCSDLDEGEEPSR